MANIIMATSRGGGVEGYFKGDTQTQVHTHPGAKMAYLTQLAIPHIHRIRHTTSKPIHVYFLAGLCDVTRKDTDKAHKHRGKWVGHYEEVTYTETTQQTVTRMRAQLQNTTSQIKEAGAIPCFCTIAPCNISTWNHHRLAYRRTTHLIHYKHYEGMQEQLHKTIAEMKGHIVGQNRENNMFTPRMADPIFRKKDKNRTPRPFYNNLDIDGVHATPDTNRVWVAALRQAIQINRGGTLTAQPSTITSTDIQGTTSQDHQGTTSQDHQGTTHQDQQGTTSQTPEHQDFDENGETLDYMYSGSDSDPDDMIMIELRVQ